MMPLVGSHEDVSCEKCHPKALFNLKGNNPDFCGNCHDSPHDGMLFGKKECEWCHSPAFGALDKFKFDHDKKTSFALGRAHGKMTCDECHTQALGERKPDKTCEAAAATPTTTSTAIASARSAAIRRAARPATCRRRAWTSGATNFNHDKKTKFKLTGARRGDVSGVSPRPHRGGLRAVRRRLGRLPRLPRAQERPPQGEVHRQPVPGLSPGAGKVDLKPGTGRHVPRAEVGVPADQGAQAGEVRAVPPQGHVQGHAGRVRRALPRGLAAQGQARRRVLALPLAGRVGRGPVRSRRRHQVAARGLHAKIADCSDCHPTRQYTGTPKTCSADGCHAKDDVHKGRLGTGCERCHKVTGDNVFNHNTMSAFPLTGGHLHPCGAPTATPRRPSSPGPQNCFGCHPEPDVHRGQYGTVCESCHTTPTGPTSSRCTTSAGSR
jgi:hypothetical protein